MTYRIFHATDHVLPRIAHVIALCACAACSPVGTAAVWAQSPPAPQSHAVRGSQSAVSLHGLQDAFAAVADELEPAVVTVFSTRSIHMPPDLGSRQAPPGMSPFRVPRRETGTGSGVVISGDGWILTNDHVVDGADTVTVRLRDGREFRGQVRRDYRSDLALIKIDAGRSLPAARLGDSDAVRVGYWAIAIGSPYRFEGSVSVGVISSLYRREQILDYASAGERFYPDLLQTDAAINPGNSGGPLCNIDGEVIGINTAIESEGAGSVGIGFAIPINLAKFVVAQLRDTGRVRYGYLGIAPGSVTPRTASLFKLDHGALLDTDPADGSPAAKAGLRAGDVITAIDGKPVRNELDLRLMVAHTPPGTTVHLAVFRDGQNLVREAMLTEAPELARDVPTSPTAPTLGVTVEPLTRKLADAAQVPPDTPGVVVKSIDASSAAADARGLVEGAVVLSVDDRPTPTVAAFTAATARRRSGDLLKFLCQFGRTKRIVIVQVD